MCGDRGHAILPVKGLIHGKSRLSAYLDAQALHALNLGNLERTVRVASEFFGDQRCVVVSPCLLTCGVVRRMGVRALVQEGNDGLNPGLELARNYLIANGANTLTVVPVDLPHVSCASLRAALGLAVGPGLAAIIPDERLEGTNLLSFPATFPLRFQYGPGSYAAHLAQLEAGELHVCRAFPSPLQVDIDSIEQLDRLRYPVT